MGHGDYEKLTPQAIDSVSAAAGGEGGQADCPGARSVHRHRPGLSAALWRHSARPATAGCGPADHGGAGGGLPRPGGGTLLTRDRDGVRSGTVDSQP